MSRGKMAVFLQSQNDFPCPVTLGKCAPSFGLHRFKQGLRFIPPDDEGFTMRGDRQRLLYKGRRRSHRFTILGDKAFEYDCILLREPESNVITLRMEGAENFDFFRQPDFVPDKFLKGSYAVYKKETLVGEGTGKLCHIHRPQIIDARGRRCWGALSVVGNELRITVPEKWLGEAKYPVVVDPTVGTTTVGSLAYPVGNPDNGSKLIYEIGVNKFLATEKIQGQCTAWAYFSYIFSTDHYYHPRVYDDNNNSPLTRRSYNEGIASWRAWYDDNYHLLQIENTPKWKSTTFNVIGTINQGSYIWFGGYGDVFFPRFDYGSIMYKAFIEYIYEDDDDEVGTEYLDFPYFGYERTYDRKISWYFEFVSQSQNYVRKLTQGVKLTDTKRITGNYKRTFTQTASANSLLGRFETFYRNCLMTVNNSMSLYRLPVFYRKIVEEINISYVINQMLSLYRKCADYVDANSIINRLFGIIRKIQDAIDVNDSQNIDLLLIRRVSDTVQVTEIFNHLGAFFRGLRINANSMAETGHKADYKRLNTEKVQAVGTLFRGLLLFIKIVSKVFIRDYLLRRFLIARDYLIVKSPVSREITLESGID